MYVCIRGGQQKPALTQRPLKIYLTFVSKCGNCVTRSIYLLKVACKVLFSDTEDGDSMSHIRKVLPEYTASHYRRESATKHKYLCSPCDEKKLTAILSFTFIPAACLKLSTLQNLSTHAIHHLYLYIQWLMDCQARGELGNRTRLCLTYEISIRDMTGVYFRVL
jgi:hypothetical protein